jgi:hypothetical protein
MKNFCFPLLLFLACFSVKAETFQVAFSKGNYEILRNGVKVSAPIFIDDTVKVFAGSVLVIRSDRTLLKILENTVVVPMEKKEDAGFSVMHLIRGAIISKVDKKKFQVRTNSAAFGVRGTQFFVEAVSDEDAWMCVNEGEVVATNTAGQEVVVPAGLGIFTDSKKVSPAKKYAWTKGINWKMDPRDGGLTHKLNLKKNYDLLNQFYD